MGEPTYSEMVIYSIVREALAECNSNGHLGLEERMALSDQIAEEATAAIVAALKE